MLGAGFEIGADWGLDDAKLKKALDPVGILDEVQALLLNRIRTRFLNEESVEGPKWKPSKAAIAEGRKTLFKTGALFHSIQAFAVGPDGRGIGTDVFYAPYLHAGTKRMPARSFMGFNDEDLTLAERLVLHRIEEALQ